MAAGNAQGEHLVTSSILLDDFLNTPNVYPTHTSDSPIFPLTSDPQYASKSTAVFKSEIVDSGSHSSSVQPCCNTILRKLFSIENKVDMTNFHVKKLDRTIGVQRSEIVQLRDTVCDLQRELGSPARTNQSLEHEIWEWKEAVHEKHEIMLSLNEKLEKRTTELQEKTIELQEANVQLAQLRDSITCITRQLSQLSL